MDLETGVHKIEPVSKEHLDTLNITQRTRRPTESKVVAGALNIESKSGDLFAEADIQHNITPKQQATGEDDGLLRGNNRGRGRGGRRRRDDEEDGNKKINMVFV